MVNKNYGWGHSSLGWSAFKGYFNVTKFLLDAGANPNIIDRNGYTPIFHAIDSGREDIVDLLLSYKANLWYKNKEGLTPIDYAVRNSQWKIYDKLINALI